MLVEWFITFLGEIDMGAVETMGIKGVQALFILLATCCVSWKLQKMIIQHLTHDGANDDEAIATYKSMTCIIVWILGILIALHILGFNMKPLFSTGGMLAVAMAFVFKNIAENLLAGMMLRFEGVITPGDVVETEGAMLRIKKIGMRTTIARNKNEEDLLIPNSQLVQEKVANFTYRDSVCRVYTHIGVSYTEDLNLVRKVLEDVCDNIECKSKQHPTEVLLSEFAESQVTYKISVWIEDPWLSGAFRSSLHEAIWWALKEAGVEMACPQLQAHLHEGIHPGNIKRSADSGAI